MTLLLGRCDLMTAGAPYDVLGRVIRRLCGLGGAEPIEIQQQRLRARIAQHIPADAQERVVLFVGELCNIPFPEEGHPMLQAARTDPKIMNDRMRRALLDWLAAECAVAPVLLCLDDLQWCDELTVSVLDEALREQAGAPLMVLSFARPEVHKAFPNLWQMHKVQELPLKGLSKKACERLIAQVLGKNVAPAAVARAVEQASGNALFLEELIRAIADGKSDEQPETVLAMLQARIGRLDSGARRAVRAAAVFGQTFWQGGVATLLGLPTDDAEVKASLAAMVHAELVQPHTSSRFAKESEYGFRHALVRDAAYSLLLATDLASGHRAAGEFLEAAGEPDAAVIAEHFERGGDKPRAAVFFLRAAENNLDRGDNLGALRQVERGLLSSPSFETEGQLRGLESLVQLWLNHYDRISEPAEVAMARLRPGSLAWCRALAPAFNAALSGPNPGRAFEIVTLALGTIPDAAACVAAVQALWLIQAVLVGGMPLPMLQGLSDKIAQIAAQTEATNPALRRYVHISRAHIALYCEPRPWTVVTEYGRALDLCAQAGDERVGLLLSVCFIEWGWMDLGDLAGARARLLALSARAQKTEDAVTSTTWCLMFAIVLAQSADEADWAQAEEIMTRILTRSGESFLTIACARAVLTVVAMNRGQFPEAALRSGSVMPSVPLFPRGLLLSVGYHLRALIGLGSYAEAVVVAEQTQTLVSQLGSFGLAEVEFRLAVSETFHAAGNPERAHTELRETLRQIQLRLDDIADPFWKHSYLTRNSAVARALALAKKWGVDRVAFLAEAQEPSA